MCHLQICMERVRQNPLSYIKSVKNTIRISRMGPRKNRHEQRFVTLTVGEVVGVGRGVDACGMGWRGGGWESWYTSGFQACSSRNIDLSKSAKATASSSKRSSLPLQPQGQDLKPHILNPEPWNPTPRPHTLDPRTSNPGNLLKWNDAWRMLDGG